MLLIKVTINELIVTACHLFFLPYRTVMKLFKKLHWSFFKGYSMFCRWRWAQIVWSLFWGLGTFFFTKCGWGAFLLCYMQNLHLEALVLLKFIKIFCHSFSRKVCQTEPNIMTYNLSYVPHYRYVDISEWLNSDIFIILKFIQWHLSSIILGI